MTCFARSLALAASLCVALAAHAGAQSVNGCTAAGATAAYDLGSPVEVAAAGFAYTPPCLWIREGQSVRWTMSFTMHPLTPGEIVAGAPQPPAAGHPVQTTSSGTTVTFEFPAAGTWPYYCGNHFGVGMMGTVFVALFADGFEDESFCDWSAVVPAGSCPP